MFVSKKKIMKKNKLIKKDQNIMINVIILRNILRIIKTYKKEYFVFV